ncbi:MAG: hypothetical protein R3C05_24520 [Pirellulaceae bacterium]
MEPSRQVLRPTLRSAVPKVLPKPLSVLINAKVTTRQATPLGVASGAVRLTEIAFANIPATIDATAHIERLREDLMVSDALPALTP